MTGISSNTAVAPLVVIVGETGSGKSALALEIAQRFNGEIISADSWAVYKHFDIGTAKPTIAELAVVPHHLINVAEPEDGFSAVLFQRLAKQVIADIAARGKLPVLVGGTGLYIDSIIFDYGFLPATDPALRAELNALSLPAVLQRAEELGLDMTGIDRRNKRRVIRLIENEGVRPTKQSLRTNTLILGLQTDREVLAERVTRRIDAMLAAGLEAEVRRLVDSYGWDLEPMKGVGYYQWKGYFEGTQSLDETRAKIIKATMDLAKRQRTWFKRAAYHNLPTSDSPFSANSVPASLDVSNDTPPSAQPDLSQESSSHKHASDDRLPARNKSIQWLTTEDKVAEAVDLVTTFLDK